MTAKTIKDSDYFKMALRLLVAGASFYLLVIVVALIRNSGTNNAMQLSPIILIVLALLGLVFNLFGLIYSIRIKKSLGLKKIKKYLIVLGNGIPFLFILWEVYLYLNSGPSQFG